MSIRIIDVCEVTKPIASPIRNAYIDFSKMTTSLVAVVTDVVRDGRRVVGYGFNSNGRYGQGGLRTEMRGYLSRGYSVVKMKIGGAPVEEDRQRIEAVLAEIGSTARLAVDVNGRFDLETAIAYAKMLRDCPLFWYEEAGDPLDFQLQTALAEFYPGPMATGENLFSHQDARNLIRYGGMRPDRDWLQFDCALSYGLCEYQRTLGALQTQGWSASRCIPH